MLIYVSHPLSSTWESYQKILFLKAVETFILIFSYNMVCAFCTLMISLKQSSLTIPDNVIRRNDDVMIRKLRSQTSSARVVTNVQKRIQRRCKPLKYNL